MNSTVPHVEVRCVHYPEGAEVSQRISNFDVQVKVLGCDVVAVRVARDNPSQFTIVCVREVEETVESDDDKVSLVDHVRNSAKVCCFINRLQVSLTAVPYVTVYQQEATTVCLFFERAHIQAMDITASEFGFFVIVIGYEKCAIWACYKHLWRYRHTLH